MMHFGNGDKPNMPQYRPCLSVSMSVHHYTVS